MDERDLAHHVALARSARRPARRPTGAVRRRRRRRRDRRSRLHRAVDGLLVCSAPIRRCGCSSSNARWSDSAPRGATAGGASVNSPEASMVRSRSSGRDAGIRMTRAIIDTVDEVGRVVDAEGIDCGFAKGGVIRLARTVPQVQRQRAEVDEYHEHGFGDDVLRVLDARGGDRAPPGDRRARRSALRARRTGAARSARARAGRGGRAARSDHRRGHLRDGDRPVGRAGPRARVFTDRGIDHGRHRGPRNRGVHP